jgi:hypothetical protein
MLRFTMPSLAVSDSTPLGICAAHEEVRPPNRGTPKNQAPQGICSNPVVDKLPTI